MKKIIFILFFIIISSPFLNAYIVIQRVIFDGNNITNYFQNTGIFNQNTTSGNLAGFFWPKNSIDNYCFTAGINAVCKIDDHLAMFAGSYRGELVPGYILNNTLIMNSDFKIYEIKSSDNANSNPDYANWYKMIPFGAPFVDLNQNCTFEYGIDKPGVKDASQTIFVCLTDAMASERSAGEGFGGGITDPILFAEVRMTAWGYDDVTLPDAQFLRYEIINKGNKNWDSTYFAIFCDPDIGDATANYLGCDSSRNLGYAFHSSNSVVWGSYGMNVLRGPINKLTGDTLYMTSFTRNSTSHICETGGATPYEAYNLMKGYKKDHSSYLNPVYTPPVRTKYIFNGDPETNTGWTYAKGFINNCVGYDSTTIDAVYPGDVRFVMGMGADNLVISPGDTQKIYISQMVAKGNSNLNSVTKVKRLSDMVNYVFKNEIIYDLNNCYNPNIPFDFSLSQNYPNPYNVITTIQFTISKSANVKLAIYDILGREVSVPINRDYNPGYYQISFDASGLASGIYFYRMEIIDNAGSTQKIYSRIKKMAVIK
jgi:hypothetical protein